MHKKPGWCRSRPAFHVFAIPPRPYAAAPRCVPVPPRIAGLVPLPVSLKSAVPQESGVLLHRDGRVSDAHRVLPLVAAQAISALFAVHRSLLHLSARSALPFAPYPAPATQLLFAQAATGLTTHGLCEEHVIAIPPARSFQGFQKEPGPRDCFQLLATALLRGDGIAEGRAETVEHAGLQEKVLYWLWLRL